MSVPKQNKLLVRNEIPNQKKFNSSQILNVSVFKSIFLQRVRFQNKILPTCQTLNQKFYNVSDIVLKKTF